MKEVLKYTFGTVAEWKKFLILVLFISIITLLEAMPVISIISFIFEKLIYLSVGVFLIYMLRHSSTFELYLENLKRNAISTFLFHYIPSATGIMFGLFVIGAFWLLFMVIVLKFTNSVFILANPHDVLMALAHTTFIAKISIGFYLIYFMFFSYIFLGKFGEALSKTNFRGAFLTIIMSLIDFRFWIKTFNFRYFFIYIVWYLIAFFIYSAIVFIYNIQIIPALAMHPNLTLTVIPLFVAITTILTFYTYFSAYFAYKTTI